MNYPRVIVVRKPGDALVLVVVNGIVVKSTAPPYVGMLEADAISAATSVMRWECAGEMEYPDITEVAP